jgi:arylformamidase
MLDIHIQGTRLIDLSHPLAPGIPVPPGFPPPQLKTIASQAGGSAANVDFLALVLHSGTHVDAPYHFFSDLPSIAEIPLDRLIGPAVVVNLTDKQGSMAIEASDIHLWENRTGMMIQQDDIVLLHTGHSQHWHLDENTREYWEHGWPYLERSAVDYLAEKQIKALGVESFDPDRVDFNHLAAAEFPTHRTLLPKGILVIENLTNLDKIPTPRCQVIALPLKIPGASGSPVRVVAVV